VNPVRRKQTESNQTRKRCRQGTKSVNAACVVPLAVVQVPIRKELQDDLTYARDYLLVLPQRIKEVQEAADAVLKAGRTQ